MAEAAGRLGDRVAALGAVALFAALVLSSWYGGVATISSVPGVDVGGSFSRSGWEAFTSSRWVWLATVLAALLAVAAGGAGRNLTALATRALVAALGVASALLIAYRIVHHRPAGSVHELAFHATGAIRSGVWIGLAAAGAIGLGACLALYGAAASGPSREGLPGAGP